MPSGTRALILARGEGFTLLELILVVTVAAVLAIFATVAVWSSLRSYRLNAAVSKTIADIRFAQQQARVQGKWYGVRFQANPVNQYHVYQTDGITDTDVVNPANRATALVIDLSRDYNATITAIDFGGGSKVEFGPMGTPYADKNGAALAGTGTVTVASGGMSRTIQVLKNTGHVE